MTSLRMRLALLLVLSIVGVIALATFAADRVMRGPPPLETTIEPVARQIRLLVQLLPGRAPEAGDIAMEFADRPAGGESDGRNSRDLNEALRRGGGSLSAFVTYAEGKSGRVASVRLPDGRWLILSFPNFGPPDNILLGLLGWMMLIVIGAAAVSFYFATVLVRPLEMLETAVSRIGPDGTLAPLPEEGSGEVRATARALNHLSARLKSAMESRMRLVAAAGHDLRTPMTRLRLRAEFLPDEDREKWLNDLHELDRIADSAIRLVREEVDEGAQEPVALGALLGDLAAELSALGLTVSTGHVDQVSVRAGALGLRRALRNLMVNAATHGKGCSVELAADHDIAAIAIADKGPGIPPELLDKAFEPFFRVDPARRKSVPGAGLGLAIAREIIERYGGTVELANRPGGGLIQTVRLKAAG